MSRGELLLLPYLKPESTAKGSPTPPTRIVAYQNSIAFLQRACDRSSGLNEVVKLQRKLDGYSKSSESISAIAGSLECRKILLELSSDLGLANDPDLRSALHADEEAISQHLALILDSKSQEEAVLCLDGDSAQSFLDVVQDILDRGFLINQEHSRMAHRIIRKLSESCDKLPSSLFITGVSGREDQPRFGGGFGDIYRASYSNQTVALKHMRHFLRGADLRRIRLKFCREALVWKDLHHPHILPFLGIDRDSFPSSLCMVSPWMEHGTVVDYLKNHGHANVDKLLFEIAQGLQYLHSRNIVHGDLRGANILINQDWSACLADFGLSVFSNATTSMHTSNRSGSIYWMAPELIAPERFGLAFARTPASDVYAFGCVCVELYTGRPPFGELSDTAAMFRIINGERAGRPTGTPAISNILWQRVTTCWAETPTTRPTAEVVVQNMVWPPLILKSLPPVPPTLDIPLSPYPNDDPLPPPPKIVSKKLPRMGWSKDKDGEQERTMGFERERERERELQREREIQIDPDGSVRSGTVPALVERLTTHEQGDPTFIKAFLMTFKSFTTVDDLFNLLVQRFWIRPPPKLTTTEREEWGKLKQHVIRIRVLNTFKSMVVDDDVLEKDDLFVLDRLKEFITADEVSKFPAAKQLLMLIERAQKGGDSMIKMVTAPQGVPPPPIVPKSSKKLKLLDIEPLELARQLTIMESQLYQRVRPMECLQRASEQRTENIDNIAVIIQTSNKIALWAVESVLSKEDSWRRAAAVKHLINVADQCRVLNNFSTMAAITAGLNTPPIRRLEQTWEQVNQGSMVQFGACETIIDSNKNFIKYRAMMTSVIPPCVPFIAIFLLTLQFIQDSNPDNLQGSLVNFRKWQMASEVINDIKRWQAPFNFHTIPSIQAYIEESLNAISDTQDSSERLWNISLEREPRERAMGLFVATPTTPETPPIKQPPRERKNSENQTHPPNESKKSSDKSHRDRIIPPDEDMRRLFQECKIGVRRANLLSEALAATPEELKTPAISEFHRKCVDSQKLIYTQIPWATGGAQRSRAAKNQEDVRKPDLATPKRTLEEALLADLLAANACLLKALELYNDLERVALEREAEQLIPHAHTPSPTHDAGSVGSTVELTNEFAGNPRGADLSLQTQQQLLAPPPPAPHGLYSKAIALYAYSAEPDDGDEEDRISFNKGDVLEILDQEGKWWRVRGADGTDGIVSSQYFSVIE